MPIGLKQFNSAPGEAAADVLRPCLDVERWIAGVVGGRPYAVLDDLLAAARTVADPFTPAEIERALAHHPRIGERARGDSKEAGLSRGEQSGLRLDDDVQRRLAEGNAAYERRFDRVFLIRAAGRSSEQILDQLTTRLGNDDETESAVVADQLRQIAVLRLQGAVSP